jgi:hypothetical protein
MSKFLASVALAVTIVPSATAFAQASQEPITRAQVRAELVELERAGYNPATGADPYYPEDIQAAEAKVAAEHAADGHAVGGVPQGTRESGAGSSTAK